MVDDRSSACGGGADKSRSGFVRPGGVVTVDALIKAIS